MILLSDDASSILHASVLPALILWFPSRRGFVLLLLSGFYYYFTICYYVYFDLNMLHEFTKTIIKM